MSFRRSARKSREWTTWLSAHRAVLMETGLPCGVYEDERFWSYFMEHGDFPGVGGVPGFRIQQLSMAQADRLLAFLRTHAQWPDSTAQRDLQIHLDRPGQDEAPSG